MALHPNITNFTLNTGILTADGSDARELNCTAAGSDAAFASTNDEELLKYTGDSLAVGRVVGGGRTKSWTYEDVMFRTYSAWNGEIPKSCRFTLTAYIKEDDLDAELEQDPELVPCQFPLSTLAPHLLVHEMKDVCRHHNIYFSSVDTKASLQVRLVDHECSTRCGLFIAMMKPVPMPSPSLENTKALARMFRLHELRPWIDDSGIPLLPNETSFTLSAFHPVDTKLVLTPGQILIDVPILEVASRASKAGLQELSKYHALVVPARWSRQQCIDQLRAHKCDPGCVPVACVFEYNQPEPRQRKKLERIKEDYDDSSPFAWDVYEKDSSHIYPPNPINHKDVARCVFNYCQELEPTHLEEQGCAVCGQLTKACDLKPFDPRNYTGTLLTDASVTRRERFKDSDPIEPVPGAVVLPGCNVVCTSCHSKVSSNKRPQMALANGLWIGEVPAVLKDLTLGEKAVISRIRRNRALVRVSKGHYKMIANVIAFPNPTPKIYRRLPPRREELDDVIAVLFTGIAPPTEEDLKRTPVLVRRARVLAALQWLRINHRDYEDLEIDHEALASYDEMGVPVRVVYRETKASDGNAPNTALPVFDEEERGTAHGPCPLTVHGLTSTKFSTMTTTGRKVAAVQHMQDGGAALAVGHGENPESLFDNPSLYPQMFPWLFPYGYGGIGDDDLFGKVSAPKHRKWLLNYHDKRFQTDSQFLITAFNHQQIKESTSASFMLTRKGNFDSVVESIKAVNPEILSRIAACQKEGKKFIPATEAEQHCFRLLDQIEYVGSRVDGSLAKRKYLRNELWSLISFQGAPSWFVTISPADNRHPVSIFWAGEKITYTPEIVLSSERERLITSNPVACAKFFDFVVQLFLTHILGWGQEQIGVFGKPAAYYGTVEQQGRMTLHLHILLWISGALSPKEIRKKLIAGDREFEERLIAYLESVQVGQFLTGTKQEVSERIPPSTLPKHKGIHTILEENEGHVDVSNYRDPTLHLPVSPPKPECESEELDCACRNCADIMNWYQQFCRTVDDLLYRCNIHRCYGKKGASGDTVGSHQTAKGCTGKDGKCTARFPREIFKESIVDEEDGHISLKKLEAMLNNVTPAVTYTNLCNCDTTSLQSGTGIKAIVGYVCDYLTKTFLKTHQVFTTMYDTFNRHGDSLLGEDTKGSDGARRMILKIVNSLGAKMEIGAPMASLYLLGNPDHYTSHEFVCFYWKNFVNFVERQWKILENRMEGEWEQDVKVDRENVHYNDGEDSYEDSRLDDGDDDDDERVRIGRTSKHFVRTSSVEDYQMRPLQHEGVSLYEWIQCSMRDTSKDKRVGLRFFKYLPEHPLADSRRVACDPERRRYVVPNFIGPPLPREYEEGDSEVYYLTMLTFFKPWRSAIDLRRADRSWKETFEMHPFSSREEEIMRNFRIRFECYDARDDFHAMRRAELERADCSEDEAEGFDVGDDLPGAFEHERDDQYWQSKMVKNKWSQSQEEHASVACQALREAGWGIGNDGESGAVKAVKTRVPLKMSGRMTASFWSDVIKTEKSRVWKDRFQRLNGSDDQLDSDGECKAARDAVFLVYGSYLSKSFVPKSRKWVDEMEAIEKRFSLNKEQRRSFRIVANHATCIAPDQMLKYLGGMAGTGKTQVLRSLIAFFACRNEPYRLVLLGPTGTSSALIGGTTYHSFLSIMPSNWSSAKGELQAIEEVRERLMGVSYIFIDEISMISCLDICRISARLCDAMNVHEKPFGGLNMILAGDFAQLPPTKGHALYSGEVSLKQSPRQKVEQQEETIGKSIWLQFTTVVILKTNMRQTEQSPDDIKFRKALENLRYRACTDEDIMFLKSRIPDSSNGLSLDDPRFKYISIITSRNVQKDSINEENLNAYAVEHGQMLHHFFSIDSKSGVKTGSSKPTLARELQKILWNQRPSTSEQVPGRLSLCLGMPVMIRSNIATDLCMTKGQEALVAGWDAKEIPSYPGYYTLETLFVELVNPPKTVKLPHLPQNIVPLTKMSVPVKAKLPNGDVENISRRQVPVLPNFSMTDYASQGKTRKVNVVDLTMCRNHQAVYTCLSRGRKAQDTIILRDFSAQMLQGGIWGWLRQEFRELNYLDKITELRFEDRLPEDIVKQTRWATITAYKNWSGGADEDEWHPVLRPEPSRNEWQRPKRDVVLRPIIHGTRPAKRKLETEEVCEPSKRQRLQVGVSDGRVDHIALVGPLWDDEDYSCAYDAWLFVLFAMWSRSEQDWEADLTRLSSSFAFLSTAFRVCATNETHDKGISKVRDNWRLHLREINWDINALVEGRRGADITTITFLLWGVEDRSPRHSTAACSRCSHWETRFGTRGVAPFMIVKDISGSIKAEIASREQVYRDCSQCSGQLWWRHDYRSFFCMQIVNRSPVTIDHCVHTGDGGTYHLFGLIYLGDNHFVARVISDDGSVHLHDGMISAHSAFETNMGWIRDPTWWSTCHGKRAVIVVYRRSHMMDQ